ncbi:MAG: cysteine hydrolase [Candidatus Parvarchaeota archaeon]|nr:cysteine hydrolase [Candidatus Parvarchaeota archaeon]MCL5101214.1 cysteine hydrolase [Candidatus Parvarchaeota archaeon]
MSKKALLVVDMVNDFLNKDVNPSVSCPRGLSILPNVTKLARFALESGITLIYCSDAHLPSDYELKVWGPHSMQGTKGSEIVPWLPTDNLYTIKRGETLNKVLAIKTNGPFNVEKGTYSGFRDNGGIDTALDNLLKLKKIDTLYITGLTTGICDRHTSAEAFFRGYNIVLVEDAVEGFTAEENEQGKAYIKANYGARVLGTEEALTEFKNGA